MPEPDAADAAYNESATAATKGSKTMKRITTTLCLAAMACVPALALAQRSTVDLGVAYNYMGSVVVEGPSGAGVPPRSSLEVGDATALMLNFEYRPTANLGLQLATSLGGTLKVDGVGGLAAQGRLFKATPYSLSALLNYHFFDEANALRPFLGIGVNFTGFSGITSYTGQSVDMSSSWSPAVQAGARYAFAPGWSLLFSIGLNWAETDVDFVSASATQQATLELRPVVFGLGVGYSF